MSRALKFVGFFLAVASIVLFLIVGLNYDSFKSMYDNRYSMAEGSEWVEYTYSMNGLAHYISEHREQVSIASIVLDQPGSSIMLGEDIPRSMGTLSNFFLLTGYADAFEQGDLDPGTELNWEDTGKYVLPQIGETTHREAYKYGQQQGLITREDQLTLKSALQILSRFNSLALSDYLLIHFGEDRILQHYDKLGLTHTDRPLPFSGLFVTLGSSIQNLSPEVILENWKNSPREELEKEVYDNSLKFAEGSERDEWLNVLRQDRLGMTFMQERNLLELFPKTTASEITRVLTDIRQGKRVSPETGEQVMEWLLYPAETEALARNFRQYGALYDNRVGLFNGLDVGISAETGETTVQALFFDQIHISVWFHMSSNHMHQDFQQRLIWDRELIETMKQAI